MAKDTWGEHALSISMGVAVLGDSQANVIVFGGGRFTDEVVVALAMEALKEYPDTKHFHWNRPMIVRAENFPDGTRDDTVNILFVKVKK
jgi:hypothetical protein